MADLPVFQFNPQSTVSGSSGADAGTPTVGIQGGNSTGGVNHYDTSPGNIGQSSLPSFLEQAFAPKIQAAKQNAMWQGFTAARAGQSLQDIHDQQPWYSKIFGPTDFEMGADMFGVQKAAADVERQFYDNMGQLKQLDPSQIGDHLNTLAQQNMTGDPFTDALIQKNLMDRGGAMIDAQQKAHYQWQQQTLASAQNQAWLSSADAFQKAASQQAQLGQTDPTQKPTPEQLAENNRTFLLQFAASQNQDPTSYMQNLVATTRQMADNGNWYAVNALRSSGLLNQLPPEQQQQLESHLDKAHQTFKTRIASGPLMQPVAQLFTQAKAGAISASQAISGMQAINDQYSALTGDDKPFFDQTDQVHVADSAGGATLSAWQAMWNHNMKQQDKAADQAAKDAADARNSAQLTQMAATNSAGDAVGLKGVSKDDVSTAFNGLVNQAMASGNNDHAAQIIVGNLAAPMPYTDDRLQQRLQQQVANSAGEQYTQGFENAYQTWKSIRYAQLNTGTQTDTTSGIAAAIKYYGKYAEPMQQYNDMLHGGVPQEQAYRSAFGNAADFANKQAAGISEQDTKDAQAQVQNAISAATPSWWNPFSGASPGNSAQSLISAATANTFATIKRNMPGISNSDAAQQALKIAQSNGLELAGSYAWQNMRGQQPLSQAAGMAPDVFSKVFASSIDNRFRAQGISLSKDTSIVPIRLADDANGPRMVITAYQDGDVKAITLTGDDLKKLRDQQAQQALIDAAHPTPTNIQRSRTSWGI